MLGSKFPLVFLMLQPRSCTLEDYHGLRCYAGTSDNLHRLLKWYKWSGCDFRAHHTSDCFSTLNQFKKPMEVGRCACITALVQLEDCSPQGCQILAAAQEILAKTLTQATSENFQAPSVDPLPRSDMNLCELSQSLIV